LLPNNCSYYQFHVTMKTEFLWFLTLFLDSYYSHCYCFYKWALINSVHCCRNSVLYCIKLMACALTLILPSCKKSPSVLRLYVLLISVCVRSGQVYIKTYPKYDIIFTTCKQFLKIILLILSFTHNEHNTNTT
jgi:hypothetical protein